MFQGAVCRSTQMCQRLRQHVARILVVDGIEGKSYPEDCGNDPEAMPKLKVASHESGLPFPRFQGAHLAGFSTNPDRYALSHSEQLLSVNWLKPCTIKHHAD